MVTRRFIMQKARRHRINQLRPLVGAWFQVLFHSPHRGAFHRSLTVLSTIGLTGVFSLTGWSRQIRAGFHVSRVTQDTTKLPLASNTELSSSVVELSRTFFSRSVYHGVVLLPRWCVATTTVWALPRSLATTEGIIVYFLFLQVLRCFSSLRSPLHLSTDNYPSGNWVVPFGNPRIKGHLHLPQAYRSLSRPSSPPWAKASTLRPFLLSTIIMPSIKKRKSLIINYQFPIPN